MIKLFEDEKIILQRRRHSFVLILELIPIFIAAVAPVIVLMVAEIFPLLQAIISEFLIFIIFILTLWWLILWMTAFILWTNYYLDVLVVTNKRVVDIEQLGLFARDVAEISISKIQDIKVEVIGPIQSLLDVGNVYIQSAGAQRELIIKGIPHPHKVREVISKIHHDVMSNR